DVSALLTDLRRAYLMELQTFYSYWLTAIVAEGWHGHELAEEFKKEALEELGHAERLATRMLELGGDPVVDPGDWAAGAGGPWTAPRRDRSDADGMVTDQIRGEAAAIRHYSAIAKMVLGKDPVTYHLVAGLLADEVGHEEHLENLVAGRHGATRGGQRAKRGGRPAKRGAKRASRR
ncbi:MAG: ferritin-like domain-containing protein, partial [Armatimonadota bacterium]|nr:ferritin-like domain-containing protein [Armatimonadota bacterium]